MNHIRQGQNNNSKRSRGRGRKPQSSGNRAYDSNGPDVKIRGTATHVCEKYQQLARDAISAGDRVMAENYYQHAEHYYRLIMASQAPNDGQPRPQNALGYRPDEDQEEDDEDFSNDQPQPHFANQPYHQQSQSHGGQSQRHNNGNGGNGGSNGRNSYQQDRNQNPNPVQEQSPEVVASVVEASESPAPVGEGDAQPVQGAVGPDGQRRRPSRRRRPRHEVGAAAGGEGGDAAGEAAAPSASGSDEAPAA